MTPLDTTTTPLDLEKLTSLCKRRGFIFQSSEIYGGLASTWDYGPLGVEMKRSIKDAWWRTFVLGRDDMVGLDSAVLMHPDVWRSSGHIESFTDPLVECKECHHRFRADNLMVWAVYGQRNVAAREEQFIGYITEEDPAWIGGAEAETLMYSMIQAHGLQYFRAEPSEKSPSELIESDEYPCPSCREVGTFTDPRLFNLMFRTFMGPVQDEASAVYLRPETAQGIFVNFINVLNSTRRKLPFGIAQIGKAFRNEITTGNFIYRTREFEMMEIEFFVKPGTEDEWHRQWLRESTRWYTDLGLDPERLHVRDHGEQELSHYSKATSDIEYDFPWGRGEIQGTASRTDYDLRAHAEASGENLSYFDDPTGEHIVPYVVEPSFGVDRAMLAFLVDAYREEEAPTASGKTERRVVLKLHPAIAPVKVAILPLSRNERLAPLAREVYDTVRSSGAIHGYVQYDDTQSIGRRYRRQDEVGTPLCVTVDFDSLDDRAVTIRDRDSMDQVRVAIDDLAQELTGRLSC